MRDFVDSMSDRWKAVERGIARFLGGKRIPLLGRKGCDLDVPFLFVEVKSQERIAPYLWESFFRQILEGAEESNEREKVPAIAIHRPGMQYGDALLCIRVRDYEHLLDLIRSG